MNRNEPSSGIFPWEEHSPKNIRRENFPTNISTLTQHPKYDLRHDGKTFCHEGKYRSATTAAIELLSGDSSKQDLLLEKGLDLHRNRGQLRQRQPGRLLPNKTKRGKQKKNAQERRDEEKAVGRASKCLFAVAHESKQATFYR